MIVNKPAVDDKQVNHLLRETNVINYENKTKTKHI